MCYHKQNRATAGELEKYYDSINRFPDYLPKYYENGFDFGLDPVVTLERPKELLPYNWGLIPWFAKANDIVRLRLQTLNCISEEMYDKPSFRDSAKEGKRCLVPCTGFYEWHWDNPTKAKNKTPFIMTRPDEGLFSIGGLYSYWKDKATGKEIFSYTVLTTVSNKAMSYVHNSKKRMPVIIPREYERDWLNPNLTEKDVLELCKSMPEDYLTYYTISKDISGNKLTSDEKNNPDIIKKVEYSQEEIDGVVADEPKKEPKAAKAKKTKPNADQQSLF